MDNAHCSIHSFVCAVEGALTDAPTNTLAFVGHSAQLNCSTNLTEPVAWYWLKHGRDQVVSMVYRSGAIQRRFAHKMRVIARGGEHNLVIDDVQLSDAGVYTCIDDNNFGKARVSVKLVVIGKFERNSYTCK